MIGREVAHMQGAENFVTISNLMVVRIAKFFVTPQMGDLSFNPRLNIPWIIVKGAGQVNLKCMTKI